MSLILTRRRHCITIAEVYWVRVFLVAVRFGWEPAGTRPPTRHADGWEGGYVVQMGQVMTPEDARAMADALGRAAEAGKYGPYEDEPAEWRELLRLLRDGALTIE